MNRSSRTSNVIKNAVGGVGGQIFTSVSQFVCRTIFIQLLSAEYLGVNGLFSNILSMLSLAELGIGQAVVFSMYKPIAENDEKHIAKLMNFYKTAYRIIGCLVGVVGISLVPFLNFFIKDPGNIENLKLIFLLILSNTFISYFFVYKGSMLTADQKSYVIVIIRNIFSVVQNVLQIAALILTKNFILYLVVQIITTFLSNLVISVYVDKKYPFLVKYKKETISKAESKSIFQKIKGLLMHKIGGFVLNGTDNLVISKIVGIAAVGVYSNYSMIINMVTSYANAVINSISAGIGNLIAKETREKTYSVFKTTLFVHFLIYGFCFNCFFNMFQSFIMVWLKKPEYLLSLYTLFIIILNFYCTGMQGAINTFTNATGLFWETRYKPIAECVINIMVSIILAYKIGITGVFIGTFASYIATFWINPVVVYKKQFGISPAKYFLRFFIYMAITLATVFLSTYVCNRIFPTASILSLIFRFLFSSVLFFLSVGIAFSKTPEFAYCKNMFFGVFRKVKLIYQKKGS